MKRHRDHWGRPTWAADDWPFSVLASHTVNDDTILKIRLPAAWAALMLSALDVLSGFVRQLEHYAEAAERHHRTVQRLDAWTARLRLMQERYDLARKSGLRHRAAVRTLLTDPRFQDLQWSFSDFNRAVFNPTSRAPKMAEPFCRRRS